MKHLLLLLCLACLLSQRSAAQNTVYGPVQIFSWDEGAALLRAGSSTWQAVTKGNYLALEWFFTEPVKAGCTREYYIMVRTADNITGCGTIQMRFWFTWAQKPGHQFDIIVDWGNPAEGSYRWIPVPPVMQQMAAAIPGGGDTDRYWRLDARINGCAGNQGWMVARISGIYALAIDKPDGTNAPLQLNMDSAAATEGVYTLGGMNNTITVNNNNVGIGTQYPQALLSVNGTMLAKKVRVSEAAANWPDYVFNKDYKLPSM